VFLRPAVVTTNETSPPSHGARSDPVDEKR
jgi:DNA modification methylase